MDSKRYNNDLLGKTLFPPYFLNKTTLVAENKPNNPQPYYLILSEKIR